MADGTGVMSAAAVQADEPARGWAVVKTNPRQELTAKYQIERRGQTLGFDYQVYVPMHLVKKQTAIISLPLFPTYIFLRAPESDAQWYPVFSTMGVREVFTDGRHPKLIDHKLIARMQEFEAKALKGFAEALAELECPFKPGDVVTTMDGLIHGIFQERLDANRIAILWSILGSQRYVKIDLKQVLS